MPRKLYVHVGPKKTGTTAIQTLLSQHDGSVVLYPRSGRGETEQKSHHPIVLGLFEVPGGRKNDVQRMLQDLSAEIRDSDRPVVISCEGLEKRDCGAFVAALASQFGGPVEAEFLVAYRDHFSRISSWYGHRIRTKRQKGIPPLPDMYLSRNARKFCYRPMLDRLVATGWPVTVLCYHPATDWVSRFLGHIGFRQDQVPVVETRNVGMNIKVLVASLATKRTVRTEQQRMRYLRQFDKLDTTRAPSKFIFSLEAAKEADKIFAPDRQYLYDRFGISAPGPQLESNSNAFSLTAQEFAEIGSIASRFGLDGRKIMQVVREYLRDD